MTTPDLPDELLARFLAGEASAADRLAVEVWAGADPANRATLDRLLAATERQPPGEWNTERAWQRVRREVQASPPPTELRPAVRASPWRSPLLRIAAVVVVAVGALLLWRQRPETPPPTVYASAMGERVEVPLPDGSLAVLAPWSTLTVPHDFGTGHRRVTLDGEGWFEATHDGPPFEVRSGEWVVRDIGTVFTVTSRTGAPAEVAVVEGAVEVRTALDTTMLIASLGAGDVGRFTRPSTDLAPEAEIATDQPVELLTAWRRGTLDVTDAPVTDVLARLSAWHGVAISYLPDSTSRSTITATLPLDSLDAALEILAPLLERRVVRGADGIRLQ